MLQAHEAVPFFSVKNLLDDTVVEYRDVWQRKNLVLVAVPPGDPSVAAYVTQLRQCVELQGDDVRLVVTADAVGGVPSPGVMVADRWGEIYYIEGAQTTAALPPAGEVAEWLQFVRMKCPECEGETR